MVRDPRNEPSNSIRLWRRTVAYGAAGYLREKGSNPRILLDRIDEVRRAIYWVAMKQFESEGLIGSNKRTNLSTCPNNVYANDFPDLSTSPVAQSDTESEEQEQGVREVLRAIADEKVKVDVIAWDIAARRDGA